SEERSVEAPQTRFRSIERKLRRKGDFDEQNALPRAFRRELSGNLVDRVAQRGVGSLIPGARDRDQAFAQIFLLKLRRFWSGLIEHSGHGLHQQAIGSFFRDDRKVTRNDYVGTGKR